MNQPNKEQIRWFWEQCGLTLEEDSMGTGYGKRCWWDRKGTFAGTTFTLIPDLNNLFKYAVPKVKDYHIGNYIAGHVATVWFNMHSHSAKDENPALALFWACFKVLGGEE